MKIIVLTLASAVIVGSAYAQAPLGGAVPPKHVTPTGMSTSDAKRDAALEKHIASLHAKLQISPAEEAQWSAVAQAMRDSAQATDRAIDKRQALLGSGTAIDNLNAYGEISQAHADSVKKLASAFAPLYAAMGDEQKKTADAVFAHRTSKTKKSST